MHEYATKYYGEDFRVTRSDKKKVQNRIDELEYIINGAKGAYDNEVITKTRKNEIVKEAETSIEEYREVKNGERTLEEVSERNKKYKAITGNKNADVEETQQKLLDLGYTSQTITGKLDFITFNNIVYYQITNGLTVTGWLDSETVNSIKNQYSDEEKEEESQSILSCDVDLDAESKYVTIKVECESSVDEIYVALSGNGNYVTQEVNANTATLRLDVPYSDDYVKYKLQVVAYSHNEVAEVKSIPITACRNKTFGEAAAEVLANGTAMLGGVVTGIVNGAIIQTAMAASNGIDYVINLGNPEQYEYNKKWRDSLVEKAENFMISKLPAEQYYYYNCGIEGGEIAEFCVGTIYAVRGAVGVVTSLKDMGKGVKAAQILLDSGDEIIVVAGKESSNVAVIATSKIDDIADAVEVVSKKLDDVIKLAKKYPDISDDLVEHIFKGQINGRGQAVGFHYEGLSDAAGKIVSIENEANAQGVYEAKVIIDGIVKKGSSTFFPKGWTPAQVLKAIEEAFESRYLVDGKEILYEGISKAGVKIRMYIKNGIITSAYPIIK